MQVTSTTFTIAEYCQQMKDHSIVVNHDYQRTDQVWPPAARSYLIETILLGFPVPKFSLYQLTDLKTRKTKKEIVDGQQRSRAILDFFDGDFRLTGKGPFSGKTYSQLSEAEQQRFVDYIITIDLFVGATPHEVRQVFRRMNSYTVPLNSQEKRHATHQGDFKWFIVELVEKYSEALINLRVLTGKQVSRMADAALLSDIIFTILEGIKHFSERNIDKLYENNESDFSMEIMVHSRIAAAFDRIIAWPEIHGTSLMKTYNFYSLVLAISHAVDPIKSGNFMEFYPRSAPLVIDPQFALPNLTLLAAAIDDPSAHPKLNEYVVACSKATTRLEPRRVRFYWISKALESKPLV